MKNKTYEDHYNEGRVRGQNRCKKMHNMFPSPIAKLIIVAWMIMDILSELICLMIHPIELAGRILIAKFKNK